MVLDFQPLDMVLRSLLFLQQQKVLRTLYPQLEKSSVQVGSLGRTDKLLEGYHVKYDSNQEMEMKRLNMGSSGCRASLC